MLSQNDDLELDAFINSTINNNYTIKEKIGLGGMGLVFRATNLVTKEDVAIKFISPQLVKNEKSRKRFLREASVGQILNHQNIIKIYESGETTEGILFIVMEYFQALTLDEYLKQHAPLSPRQCLEILKPICQA